MFRKADSSGDLAPAVERLHALADRLEVRERERERERERRREGREKQSSIVLDHRSIPVKIRPSRFPPSSSRIFDP
jgi:hypothetical protein